MIQLYIENLKIWAAGFGQARRAMRAGRWSWYRQLGFCAYWLFDVGINALTGGDPRESLSSAWYKDRHSVVFARLMTDLLELIDSGHGRRAYNPRVGEHSVDNRELPGKWRVAIVALWLIAIGLVVQLLRSIGP